jgi:hypothetical protein
MGDFEAKVPQTPKAIKGFRGIFISFSNHNPQFIAAWNRRFCGACNLP